MVVQYEPLDEIHAIQRKHYETRKHLGWEEKRELIEKKTEEFLASKGYSLVPGKKGCRMVKKVIGNRLSGNQ
ncbi:hypothetical protein KKB84_03140 [bacterium]|nr:hypothetical protein [bacterium]